MIPEGISVVEQYRVDADPLNIKFSSVAQAVVYREKLKIVLEIEALLPNPLRDDPRFCEGEGYVQHEPQKVIDYRKTAYEKLMEYEGELLRGFQRTNDCFAALGMMGKTKFKDLPLDDILIENNSPFYIISRRLDHIDEYSREWAKYQTRENVRLF